MILLLQSRDCAFSGLPPFANRFKPDLSNFFQLPFCANYRCCAVAGPELTDTMRYETHFTVLGMSAGASGKDSCLDFGKVLWWNEEDKLVARVACLR